VRFSAERKPLIDGGLGLGAVKSAFESDHPMALASLVEASRSSSLRAAGVQTDT
jgi:hypothetical protein